MSKRRKIIIALCVLTVGVLVIGALGYSLFSRKGGDTEIVFAPTEVGTPVGDKVTKVIGPAGGSIASPDGRLTLTVPQNALAETVAFGIQPVTNKFDGGLGLAYGLEPDGKTFTTPLDISVHYDDHDLEGTIPEALSVAYQDKEGAWHMQKAVELDKEKKTITVSTTHFSTFDLVFGYKLLPAKATLHVGESLKILVTNCNPANRIMNFLHSIVGLDDKCHEGWGYDDRWRIVGEGKLTQNYPIMIYKAPGKKPTPNVATVVLYDLEFMVAVERPCTPSDTLHGLRGKNDEREFERVPKKCFKQVPGPESLESVITIIDRGYRATGPADIDGGSVFFGNICDLEKPFNLSSTNPLIASFELEPNSSNGGTWKIGFKGGLIGGSGGKYTVEGSDTEKTGISYSGSGTGTCAGCPTFTGNVPVFHLTLTPLTGNECGGG